MKKKQRPPKAVWAIVCPDGRVAATNQTRKDAAHDQVDCDRGLCECEETPHRVVRYAPVSP